MGFPIFPTVFTLYRAVFKIFSIILQVVDFPLVPVIEIIKASSLSSKNKSKSVIILFEFFFKISTMFFTGTDYNLHVRKFQ